MTNRILITYDVTETDEQRKEREKKKLPRQTYSFTVSTESSTERGDHGRKERDVRRDTERVKKR